jgi:dTDP-4-amino-4,6-dideoxygalactose transaminase
MILMNDFRAEPQELRDEMRVAVSRVLDSGWYLLGNETINFEKAWAAICGVNHAVGVGNGMDAIEIALRALNIGAGDEVITTPMTAFATVLAIMRAGAQPVLADIDATTALLSLDSVRRCITGKTRAIVLVHLYGQIRDMQSWVGLCDQHGIALIEDCAQAHLASWTGGVAGSFGRAGAYSFYPTKNLGAVGDAGMLVTHDEKLAGRAAMLRNYGQSTRYHHPEPGLNSRMDEIQAALLTARLRWLPTFTRRRQEIAATYRASLRHPQVRLLAEPVETASHVYHLFVVTCKQRDALQAYVQQCDVQTLIHYPIPVHWQEPCKKLKRDPAGLVQTELHAASCVSLPCHPQMTDNDVMTVIAAINSFEA